MGVHGLWKLIEPSGKPVPLETLENKILAVDVSIWLHQLVKGFQDSSGSSLPNAHLLGLFHRICKLLFYKIKPVFVFDGGVPLLKKQTIAARRAERNKADETSTKLREQILKNLIQQKAVGHAAGTRIPTTIPTSQERDLFELPPEVAPVEEAAVEGTTIPEEDEEERHIRPSCSLAVSDLRRIDVNSEEFKSLPPDMRHDILSEMKDLRKRSSWKEMHEMPENLGDFSHFQLKRLLKQRNIQVSLEEAAKEMGGRTLSLGEMQKLFEEDGVLTETEVSQRIASDCNTRFVYIPGGRKATKQASQGNDDSSSSTAINKPDYEETVKKPESRKRTSEEEAELLRKIRNFKDETLHFVDDSNSVDYMSVESDASSCDDDLAPVEDIVDEDELTQAQILQILEDSKKADKKVLRSDSKACENQISAVEDELAKMFCDETNPVMSESDHKETIELKPCDNILRVFDDVLNKNEVPVSKSSYESIKNINIKPNEKVGFKPDEECTDKNLGPESGKDSQKNSKSEVINFKVKEEIKVEFESPDKTKIDTAIAQTSVSVSDSESGSDDFVDVDEQKEMNLIYQRKKIEEIVEESIKKEEEAPCVEIVIERSKCQVDSLFADIFQSEGKSTSSRNDCESNVKAEIPTLQVVKNGKVPQDRESAPKFSVSVKGQSETKTPKILEDSSLENRDQTTNNVKTNLIADSVSEVISNESSSDSISLERETNLDSNPANKSVDSFADETPKKRDLEPQPSTSAEAFASGSFDLRESNFLEDRTREINEPEPQPSTSAEALVSDSPDLMQSNESQEDSSEVSESAEKFSQHFDPETLKNLQSELEIEQDKLLLEKGKQERLAANITEQMNLEAQELLKMFGIPFIIAPMEAEAQCAFLDSASLTEGTITDDSDIWLFGGSKVYKNFFDQKKHVLQFRMLDINHFFKLSRSQLIQLALLVGSDYTPGLTNVGPVTAIEILSFFKESSEEQEHRRVILSGLEKFKVWLNKPENIKAHCAFANKLKNVTLHPGFPNPAVIDAYLNPEVDESLEGFSWGSPDVKSLEDFGWEKFGWTKSKVSDLLSPVLKKIAERTNQQSIDRYFQTLPKIPRGSGKVSKRVQRAIDQLSGEKPAEEIVEGATNAKKRKTDPKQPQEPASKRQRKKKSDTTPSGSDLSANKGLPNLHKAEVVPQKEKDNMDKVKRKLEAIKVFQASKRGGRGRGRRKSVMKRAGKIEKSSYLSESSDSN